MRRVCFKDLGLIDYKEAWDYQESLFKPLVDLKYQERDGKDVEAIKKQYLLFCEHNPVFTLGKSGDKHNLLLTKSVCESKKIDYYEINRGGDITFHGPGQLVAYPIVDLEEYGVGVKKYISMLEDVVIETLKYFGIKGEKDDKAMGVWLDVGDPKKARKICAIGVKCSRYITMHGLALNVNTDMNYFNYINPCGFTDRGVTSMEKELGDKIDFEAVSTKMRYSFEHIFCMTWK